MADRVFCIDLGSAFTKVGLRRGRRANSDLVTDSRLTTLDDLRLCLPTTVAIDFSSTPAKPIFGDAALDRRPGKTMRVFANWKKELFAEAARSEALPVASQTAPPPRTPSRLESLLNSNEFLHFATRYGVAPTDVASLQKLLSSAATILAPPPAAGSVVMTTADSDAFKVAVLFFRHLRRVVLEVCRAGKIDIPNPELIPARLSVPAFAPEKDLSSHRGCRWLVEAMQRAEWTPVDHRPIVSEPYANAIGVLTRGSNCTREKEMLQNGLLATCLSEPKTHPEYRAVVIDVGAFTVDFAALTYRPEGQRTLNEVEFERHELSVPLGVSELDAAVLGILPHRQVAYLRDQASANDWMAFRPRVYSERQFFPTPHGEICSGDDVKGIGYAIQNYADRLSEQTAAFFSTFPDASFKELILTGGGNTIPAIQDALISAAEAGREKFRKVHLPAVGIAGMQRKGTSQQPVAVLDGRLTRGATALGGSGSFFDMDREPYPLPTA